MINLCKGNSNVGIELMANWIKICTKQKQKKENWITDLRQQDVKAAHPDDGWVDRNKNIVRFAYPQFNDGVCAGDIIALGDHFDKFRLVKIIKETGFEEWLFSEEIT